MSTKCTIAHGDGFHLYEDCFDREAVWLSLERADFEVRPDEATVRIPKAVWEYVRKFAALKFDLIAKSDRELLKMARAWAAKSGRSRLGRLTAKQAFASLKNDRAEQRGVLTEIDRLKRKGAKRDKKAVTKRIRLTKAELRLHNTFGASL